MKEHIIITNGRSGSNYLSNLLNAHPRVVNYGEVLGDWNLPYKLHHKFNLGGKSVTDYLHYIYTSPFFFYAAQFYSLYTHLKKRKKINFKFRNKIESLGIKEFSINFKKRNINHWLQNNNDIFVINLFRENQLKRLISVEMMKHSNVVYLDNKSTPKMGTDTFKKKKIYLNPKDILNQLSIYEQEIDEQNALARNTPSKKILNIRYEDLFSSSQSQAEYTKKIFNFLNVEQIYVESSHKKILSDKLPDLIENYEEIKRILQNSPFANYLDS